MTACFKCPYCDYSSCEAMGDICPKCGHRVNKDGDMLNPFVGEIDFHWLACAHCKHEKSCHGVGPEILIMVDMKEAEKVYVACRKYAIGDGI